MRYLVHALICEQSLIICRCNIRWAEISTLKLDDFLVAPTNHMADSCFTRLTFITEESSAIVI